MIKQDNFKENGGNFNCFTAVVEDINDPEEMGRVKVRVFGYHSDSLQDITTADLPWATVMLPITSASMSSIGTSATGLLHGSWVIGFFRDGPNGQDPVILGSIPSMSSDQGAKGFSDPDKKYPRKRLLDQPDTPEPARKVFKESTIFESKDMLVQEKIETADSSPVDTVGSVAGGKGSTWDSLKPADIIAPVYPKNHVKETESGHVIEHDDTPGKERISEFHRTGTHTEIDATGSRQVYIVGDGYEITLGSKNVYIKGDVNLTIDGNLRTLVKGNYNLEVEGDKTEYIKGSRASKIGGNELLEIDKQYSANITEDYSTLINGNETRSIAKDLDTTVIQNTKFTTIEDQNVFTLGHDNKVVKGNASFAVSGTFTLGSSSELKIESGGDFGVVGIGDVTMEGSTINLN